MIDQSLNAFFLCPTTQYCVNWQHCRCLNCLFMFRLIAEPKTIKQKQTKMSLVCFFSAECERSFISNRNDTRENKELYKRVVYQNPTTHTIILCFTDNTLFLPLVFRYMSNGAIEILCVHFPFNSHDSISFAHNRDEWLSPFQKCSPVSSNLAIGYSAFNIYSVTQPKIKQQYNNPLYNIVDYLLLNGEW